MTDVQVWAVIIGVFMLLWHAINVVGRLHGADRVIRAAEVEQQNGHVPQPSGPDPGKRQS